MSTFQSPNILSLSPYPGIVRNIDHKLERNPICPKYESDPPEMVGSSVLMNLLGFKDPANHGECQILPRAIDHACEGSKHLIPALHRQGQERKNEDWRN